MGVEPTKESFAPPLNGFEDRGAHQDSITPQLFFWTRQVRDSVQGAGRTRHVSNFHYLLRVATSWQFAEIMFINSAPKTANCLSVSLFGSQFFF
jgi:hypothetical protein